MPRTTDQTSEEAALPRDKVLSSDDADLFERFSRITDARHAFLYQWLDERLRVGRRALDVNCGTGVRTVKLADRYDDVVGVDAAPALIEMAERERSRPTIRYQVRDVLSMTPERDGLFDAVLAVSCIVHIGSPDVVLTCLRRLVAPGGILLVAEPERPPNWGSGGSGGWQVDLAFRTARSAFDAIGDIDAAAVALQWMLNPTWLKILEGSMPLTREQFGRECSAALPNVTIDEESGRPGLFAVWRAPAG